MSIDNHTEVYTYKYPHPAVTTDCVVFGFDGKELMVLLIERGLEPYKGMWAFPGGFIRMNETAEECARRETEEETGLLCGDLELLMIRSGKDTYYEYPNQDKVYFAGIIYICFDFKGEMKVQEEEVIEQAFFPIDALPDNLSPGTIEVVEKAREYLAKKNK